MNRIFRLIRIPLIAASLTTGVFATNIAFADPPQPGQPAQHAHARHARGHRGGGLLGASLRSVTNLRPEQRQQIEQIKSLLKPGREAAKAARKDFATALASEVETGTIDFAALGPKANVVVLATANVKTQERAAIDGLHRVLDKDQRVQLADAIEARMAEPRTQGQAHRGHGAGRRLAKELSLTDAQKQQIRAIFQDEAKSRPAHVGRAAAKEQATKMLEAFKADAFSIDLAVPINAAQKSRDQLQHFVGFVQKVMPVLTATQRSVAADKIRAHAAHGKLEL